MTDKEIIIDGVDVSKCIHYKNKSCIADYCLTDMPFDEAKCKLNPNCYFKQLKRKEQECEEINLRNERLVVEKYTMNEEILKLKQALDEIKEIAEKCRSSLYGYDQERYPKQILQKISEVLKNE